MCQHFLLRLYYVDNIMTNSGLPLSRLMQIIERAKHDMSSHNASRWHKCLFKESLKPYSFIMSGHGKRKVNTARVDSAGPSDESS